MATQAQCLRGHSATVPMPAKPGYIDSLTPLRGIAALWVVVFHANAAALDASCIATMQPPPFATR